jgi:hypothetical protein
MDLSRRTFLGTLAAGTAPSLPLITADQDVAGQMREAQHYEVHARSLADSFTQCEVSFVSDAPGFGVGQVLTIDIPGTCSGAYRITHVESL